MLMPLSDCLQGVGINQRARCRIDYMPAVQSDTAPIQHVAGAW